MDFFRPLEYKPEEGNQETAINAFTAQAMKDHPNGSAPKILAGRYKETVMKAFPAQTVPEESSLNGENADGVSANGVNTNGVQE